MANLGFNSIGRNAGAMMSLDDPPLDWVALANGMGVEAARVDTCEAFADTARPAPSRRGPFLIECVTLESDQAVCLTATPCSVRWVCSSPDWNISRTISAPPMNSPLM